MWILLNPFTFVDLKRGSRENEPDRSELPDRVPEETVLKVKRRRLSAPEGGGGGGGGSGEDICYLSVTSTTAAVAHTHLSVTADTTSCFSTILGLR